MQAPAADVNSTYTLDVQQGTVHKYPSPQARSVDRSTSTVYLQCWLGVGAGATTHHRVLVRHAWAGTCIILQLPSLTSALYIRQTKLSMYPRTCTLFVQSLDVGPAPAAEVQKAELSVIFSRLHPGPGRVGRAGIASVAS